MSDNLFCVFTKRVSVVFVLFVHDHIVLHLYKYFLFCEHVCVGIALQSRIFSFSAISRNSF